MGPRSTRRDTMSADSVHFTPRQTEILDKALDLIRAEGLAGLTMGKVAARMGFSEPAMYRHFKTKQDLVLGIILRLEVALIDPMRRIAARDDRTVADRLTDILLHHLDLVVDNNALPILLFAEASMSPDERLGRAMAEVFASYEKLLRSLIREGRRKKEINPRLSAEDGAMILIGAPAACALRLRLLHSVPRETKRRRLASFVRSQILMPTEMKE